MVAMSIGYWYNNYVDTSSKITIKVLQFYEKLECQGEHTEYPSSRDVFIQGPLKYQKDNPSLR